MPATADAHIYVVSPDITQPTGGIKVLYRHVDILNANGFSASILHQQTGFRCTWFPNTTKVDCFFNARIRPSDFVVLPEIFGPRMADFARGTAKIIYNQSGSLTFQEYPLDGSGDVTAYTDPEVIGCFAISDNVIDYLHFAFPALPIHRMRWSIDQSLFSVVGSSKKKRQICFMPRRRPEDALQVFNLLRFRGALEGFNVVPIDNMTAEQTAQVMGQSLLFFSFGYPEGLPLPPAEAMSRGCIVVGYHGFGGREYFKPEICFPVEPADVLGFAKTAADVLDACRRGDSGTLEKGRLASKYMREHYSRATEERDVVEAWTRIFEARG